MAHQFALRVSTSELVRVKALSQQHGPGFRRFMLTLISRVVAQLLTGELTADDVRLADKQAPKNNLWRFWCPDDTHQELLATWQRTGLSETAIVRAAIRYSVDFRRRLELEEHFTKAGGSGDPSVLSDSFLTLWVKHYEQQPVDMLLVIQTLGSMERRLRTLEDASKSQK